jgi:hypothetical protein
MRRAYFTDYAVAQRVAAAARDLGYSPTIYIGNEGFKVAW